MRRTMIRRSLVMLPAAALALTSGLVPAQAAGSPGWRTVATVSRPSLATFLLGVAAAGPRHAWAVGFASSTSGNTDLPVVESWNGSAWSPVTLPAGVVSKFGQNNPPLLDTAAAPGPGNVWAFTLPGGVAALQRNGMESGHAGPRPRSPSGFAGDGQKHRLGLWCDADRQGQRAIRRF
jgi:hypothetical protein